MTQKIGSMKHLDEVKISLEPILYEFAEKEVQLVMDWQLGKIDWIEKKKRSYTNLKEISDRIVHITEDIRKDYD